MYISVRVVAGAKREEVKELPKGRLEVRVKEPAKQNLANKRVQALVAERYELPLHKVHLISGHHTPAKLFAVDIDD